MLWLSCVKQASWTLFKQFHFVTSCLFNCQPQQLTKGLLYSLYLASKRALPDSLLKDWISLQSRL
jgi:hypothetical protein